MCCELWSITQSNFESAYSFGANKSSNSVNSGWDATRKVGNTLECYDWLLRATRANNVWSRAGRARRRAAELSVVDCLESRHDQSCESPTYILITWPTLTRQTSATQCLFTLLPADAAIALSATRMSCEVATSSPSPNARMHSDWLCTSALQKDRFSFDLALFDRWPQKAELNRASGWRGIRRSEMHGARKYTLIHQIFL